MNLYPVEVVSAAALTRDDPIMHIAAHRLGMRWPTENGNQSQGRQEVTQFGPKIVQKDSEGTGVPASAI